MGDRVRAGSVSGCTARGRTVTGGGQRGCCRPRGAVVDKLVVVGRGTQGEAEDPEGVAVPFFAAMDRSPGGVMIVAAGSDDEFADAVCLVDLPGGGERREALVFVGVSVQDDVCPGGIQVVPQCGQGVVGRGVAVVVGTGGK